MSLCDMSESLSGMPFGATDFNPAPVHPNAVAPDERRSRTPVFLTGVRETCGWLFDMAAVMVP